MRKRCFESAKMMPELQAHKIGQKLPLNQVVMIYVINLIDLLPYLIVLYIITLLYYIICYYITSYFEIML